MCNVLRKLPVSPSADCLILAWLGLAFSSPATRPTIRPTPNACIPADIGALREWAAKLNKPLFVALRLLAFPLTWLQYASERSALPSLIRAAHAPTALHVGLSFARAPAATLNRPGEPPLRARTFAAARTDSLRTSRGPGRRRDVRVDAQVGPRTAARAGLTPSGTAWRVVDRDDEIKVSEMRTQRVVSQSEGQGAKRRLARCWCGRPW